MASIDGLERAIAAFTRLSTDVEAPGHALEKAGRVLLDGADRRVPRGRTHRLAGSGRVDRGSVVYGSASVPYAAITHWGSVRRGITRRPWLVQTMNDEATLQRVLEVWTDETNDLVKRIGG